ncbi:hypothetical protein [uncultured Devosia sp.]|uniref:hypothetical protein n=1 Tax=uncultured Devosia sp. TaxID=211434 RepID=UPI00262CBCCC|nr:hypothetical protein [uncultured Devosia sp.]
MSDGFSIVDGQIVIEKDGRIVSTTDGTLVNLLPEAYDFESTINVVFPDFTKDYAYNWQWANDYNVGLVAQDNACATAISVPAQEWSSETDLADAPTGADIFVGRVRINRTVAPSHTWGSNAIELVQPSNVWIPFSGSLLMEAEVGMARAFSLYLSGGKLKLHRQQSVSVPPGGWGSYGGAGFNWTAPADSNGGEWVYGTSPGIPVVEIETKNSPGTIEDADMFAPLYKTTHRRGGSDACSTSLSTNFSSTYQVEVVGKFGRRS